MITFGVKIATYRRRNDATRACFPKTIESLLAQTYPHWKAYIVGDKYEPDEEFQELVSLIPEDKRVAWNNPDGGSERAKYSGKKLWMCAGRESVNKLLDRMTADGIEIVTTLDDDDVWLPNHLETLNEGYTKFPEAVCVLTRGRHVQMGLLPRESPDLFYNNRPPIEHATINATVSWNIQRIPLRYENTVETHDPMPGDANMWMRMRRYMADHGMKYLYIPTVTVWHDEHNPDTNEGCIHQSHSEFLA